MAVVRPQAVDVGDGAVEDRFVRDRIGDLDDEITAGSGVVDGHRRRQAVADVGEAGARDVEVVRKLLHVGHEVVDRRGARGPTVGGGVPAERFTSGECRQVDRGLVGPSLLTDQAEVDHDGDDDQEGGGTGGDEDQHGAPVVPTGASTISHCSRAARQPRRRG